MHTSPITKIVIRCSATQNGKQLRTTTQTAAQRIDDWHKQRGFQRLASYYKQFNPHLQHIGYHFVIDTDGTVETGRREGETGAHVKGHNLALAFAWLVVSAKTAKTTANTPKNNGRRCINYYAN